MIVLLVLLAIAIIGIRVSESNETYGSRLDSYVVSRNPTDASDVERLIREFDRRSAGDYFR